MKMLKNLFIAATISMFSIASYAGIVLTPSIGSPVSGEFTPVTVKVAGGSVSGVSIVYRTLIGGETAIWVTNALTEVGGLYRGEIPPLPVADVQYYATATDASGLSVDSLISTYSAGAVPSTDRYWDFSDGTYEEVATETYDKDYCYNLGDGRKWSAHGVLINSRRGNVVPGGTAATLMFYNYPTESKSHVTSPAFEGGVGTIYYSSKLFQSYTSGALAVQVSYVDEPQEEDWKTVEVLEYPRVTRDEQLACHAKPIVLNDYNIKRVRFLRVQANDYSENRKLGYIMLDNIAISRPPAFIEMAESLRNPGYPSRDQSIKMRVRIIDRAASSPTLNRQVRVYYKWAYAQTDHPSSAGWSSIAMAPIGDDIYEGTIPTQKVGFINYYYECSFDGYYYQRDPDGEPNPEAGAGAGTEPLHSESRSPVYWSNGEMQSERPEIYSQFEVRPYRSVYGNVAMISEPATTTVSNMTLIADEVWQAVTLVTGVTNLVWKFVGYDRYTDDATEFQKEPVVWGDNDQAFINPPLGGFVEVDAQKGIEAELEYTGFLLMRFSTTKLDYMVKRAVWQDFNEWQASQDYFEESLGLYATTPYAVDFDIWSSDGYDPLDSKGTGFQADPVTSVFDDYDTFTFEHWIRSKSRIIQERQIEQNVERNRAVDIQRGGFVGNGGDGVTYGLSRFSYRVRTSLADDHWALYKDGTALSLPLEIKPVFYVSERADSEHYVGLIFCYQDGQWGETPGYYELRFIQAAVGDMGADNARAIELWRQDPGSFAPVQVGERQGLYRGKFTTETKPVVKVAKEGGSVVVNLELPHPSGEGTDTRTFKDSNPGKLALGGTIGFGTYDAVPIISSVRVGTELLPKDEAAWYLGGKRLDDTSRTRWEFIDNSLTRAVPQQTLSIFATEQVARENTPDTAKLQLKRTGIRIDSLKYQSYREIFNVWNRQFLQLRYVSGEGNVVVDDVRNEPWRAMTRAFDNSAGNEAQVDNVYYYDWTDVEKQQNVWLADNPGWVVLEGWTTNSLRTAGSEVIFDHSRANENLVQALLSPVMTNGLGSITFTYRVTGGGDGDQVIYSVDRSVERMIDTWETVAVYTNRVREEGARYTKIATPMKGRGRIRIRIQDGTSKNAALHVDNVIAKDYPPRDKTTWLAYNARITDKIEDSTLIYNGRGKSAFLNNSYSEGVVGTEVLDEHEPFIQSPEVGTGIGEISFVYRTFTPGKTSRIIVKVAPSEDTPEENWKVVTNIVVKESSYVQFSNPKIFDIHDKVLRIYASTQSDGRFAIDNILVTEPVRAGYEIFTVRLVPEQPIAGKNTRVEAEIGRFMMDPKDVQLFVTFHDGADNWGYDKWWSRTDVAHTRPLHRVGPKGSRLYRTDDNLGIPGGTADQIVQYVVWGVHSEIKPDSKEVIFQGTNTFVNPEWYGEMDLNKEHENEGWSPYYMVYSCAPGQVWVNEFNYHAINDDAGLDEYIEIAAPANVSLNGWVVKFYSYLNNEAASLKIDNAQPVEGNGEGWRFYVIGTKNMQSKDQALPAVTPYPQNPGYFDKLGAGIALYRNTGILEQKFCWGKTRDVKQLIANGYENIGYKSGSTDSLSLISNTDTNGEYYAGSSYSDFNWKTLGHTPGRKNLIEGIGNKQIFLPFIPGGGTEGTTFLLTSSLVGNGTQNDGISPILQDIASGASASIVYKADEWNKIASLTANDIDVPEAVGQKSYTYEIAAMEKDVDLMVTFAPSYPDVPLAWLEKWGKTEEELSVDDGDGFSLEDEYLLNTDPTQATTVSFFVSSVLVDEKVKVTAKLVRSDGTTDYSKGRGVNGLLRLYSAKSLDGDFLPDQNAGLAGAFNGKEEETFELPFSTGPFFKAVIDPMPVLQ